MAEESENLIMELICRFQFCKSRHRSAETSIMRSYRELPKSFKDRKVWRWNHPANVMWNVKLLQSRPLPDGRPQGALVPQDTVSHDPGENE